MHIDNYCMSISQHENIILLVLVRSQNFPGIYIVVYIHGYIIHMFVYLLKSFDQAGCLVDCVGDSMLYSCV